MSGPVTPALALVPFFYYEPGQRIETYAQVEREGTEVSIKITSGAMKCLIRKEEEDSGALLKGLALLYNYFYLDHPIPPRAIRRISIIPDRDRAFITFQIGE